MKFKYYINGKPTEWKGLSDRQQANASSMKAAIEIKSRVFELETLEATIKLGFSTLKVEAESPTN